MTKVYMKYGGIIAATLILYFLSMTLFGLQKYPVLSILNAVLYGGGIMRAMQTFKRDSKTFDYADGWQVGFMSGAVATLIFTAFMAVYMLQIDTEFASALLATWNTSYTNGVSVILFSIVLMGMSTAVVLALTFMQLLKSSVIPKRID